MGNSIIKLWRAIENLSKEEMFDLLKQYNYYVIEVCDREDGSVPVCLLEYFENEYCE